MSRLHIAILLSIIGGVEMFSRGAPDSACKTDMQPKHGPGVSGQQGPSPYTLTLSQTDYRPRENITVTLSGKPPFKGFLIMATTVPSPKDGVSTPQPVGKLTSFASSASRCEGAALTHTSAVTKRSLTFTWKSPDTDVGLVVFRYTVVKDKKTYWANMVSEKLEFNNKTTEGDDKDEWDLGDDEYEYWDEWVEDKLPEFEDKFPDESFPDVTENGTVLTSTATVDGSVTPAVSVNTGKTPTAANVSPVVSVTPTANINAGVTPTVTVNVNAALPVVVNISETPTSFVDIGLTQTATVNAKNKDGWSVSDTVGEDISKLTGDKPDSKKIQPNTANDLSGDKINKGSGPKTISNTQKAKASSEEELQSAKKTDDNGSHSSRLLYSSSVIGFSLFGLMLLVIA